MSKKRERDREQWERDAQSMRSELKRSREMRMRVVRAFIALRDLKASSPYPESAIRRLRVAMLNLPSSIASDLEFEDEQTIQSMLQIAMWNILDDFERRLSEMDAAPITPINARYLAADQALQHGDLLLEDT